MTDTCYENQQSLSIEEALNEVGERLGIINCSPSTLYDIGTITQRPYSSKKCRFDRFTWPQLELASEKCDLLERLSDYANKRDILGKCEITRLNLISIKQNFRNELSKFDNSGVKIINGRVAPSNAIAA